MGGRAGPRLPVAARPAQRGRGEGSQEAHADEPLQRPGRSGRGTRMRPWTLPWRRRMVGPRTSPTRRFSASCWRSMPARRDSASPVRGPAASCRELAALAIPLRRRLGSMRFTAVRCDGTACLSRPLIAIGGAASIAPRGAVEHITAICAATCRFPRPVAKKQVNRQSRCGACSRPEMANATGES